MAEGREGDWECNGCRNRNYAFRSFCNRCKQPRIFVDTKTPPDSKWLPRIGDWICTGCTNNNYASREKCKKCGQPKEIAALPAIAIPGSSLPPYLHYFPRGPEQKMNITWPVNDTIRQPLPPGTNWLPGADGYSIQPSSNWPLDGRSTSMLPYASPATQFPEGWLNGDWICPCGFRNYSSREQCKKCNHPMPPAHGTKRLASEELVNEWDKRRLIAGQSDVPEQNFLGQQMAGFQRTGLQASFPPGSILGPSNMQVNMPLSQFPPLDPTSIPGKGARQWREGDWMCSNCSNHNYASRTHCNRCKTGREMVDQSVSVA